jgi:signal transduction histidine kinase
MTESRTRITEEPPAEEKVVDPTDRGSEYFRILDLHDEVGQLRTAILANLQRLRKYAAGTHIHGTIRDTQHLVENLFYTIRSYVRGARPSRDNVPALIPALRKMAETFTRRTGIGVIFRCDCDPEILSREHKTVLFRVVQECLTNVFRHSEATGVTVGFTRSGGAILLEIEDDGGTVRPESFRAVMDSGDGSGLRGMRERVRLIGGECTARYVEGRGMCVNVRLPYNIS